MLHKLMGSTRSPTNAGPRTWTRATETTITCSYMHHFTLFSSLLTTSRLCNDVDLSNPEVQEDTKQWVDWIGLELNLAGLRLDAVKHMSQAFMKDYIQYIRQRGGRDWLLVGEYAAPDNTKALMEYIRTMNGKMSLFDFPLLRNFIGISRHEDADLRFVFGDTLSEKMSKNSVVCYRMRKIPWCSILLINSLRPS